jgi:hypothetical protein
MILSVWMWTDEVRSVTLTSAVHILLYSCCFVLDPVVPEQHIENELGAYHEIRRY